MNYRIFLMLMLLAIWCGFSNSLDWVNILMGCAIIIPINFFFGGSSESSLKFNPFLFIYLILVTLWLLLVSSILVAREILRVKVPQQGITLTVPLNCSHRFQVLLLAHIISVTPGTLCLDVSEDMKYMVIHSMLTDDPNDVIDEVTNKLERLVLKVLKYD